MPAAPVTGTAVLPCPADPLSHPLKLLFYRLSSSAATAATPAIAISVTGHFPHRRELLPPSRRKGFKLGGFVVKVRIRR